MPVHFLDRVHRPACGTIAVGIVLEVGLEDRFQHDLGSGLDHPIANGRNAERTLASAIRLSGSSPAAPDRAGTSSRPVPRASPPAMPPGPAPRSARKSPRPRPARPHWRGPARRRGAGCPRGRSCRRAHRSGRQAPPSPCDRAFSEGSGSFQVFARLIANHLHLAIFESAPEVRVLCSAGITRPQRSYDPVRLPPWPPPDATLRPLPSPSTGLPRLPEPPFRRAVPTTPADRSGCACRLLPRSVQPSPNGRRVGIRIVTFEACSGFTRVTARRIAQPPKATFVTRLRPGQLPGQAARQLPDQSTILWVESSSTDDSRLRGALPTGDISFRTPRPSRRGVSFPQSLVSGVLPATLALRFLTLAVTAAAHHH